MTDLRSQGMDVLFDAILSLQTREDCYRFFEDLCTVKELTDMAQRLEGARLLAAGESYAAVAEKTQMSSATISRINRCLRYGTGGYRDAIQRSGGANHE